MHVVALARGRGEQELVHGLALPHARLRKGGVQQAHPALGHDVQRACANPGNRQRVVGMLLLKCLARLALCLLAGPVDRLGDAALLSVES